MVWNIYADLFVFLCPDPSHVCSALLRTEVSGYCFIFLVSCLFQSRSGHLRENSQCWKAKMNVKRMCFLTSLHLYTSLKGNLRWNVCRCHGHCQFHLKPMQVPLALRRYEAQPAFEHLFTENIGSGNFVEIVFWGDLRYCIYSSSCCPNLLWEMFSRMWNTISYCL